MLNTFNPKPKKCRNSDCRREFLPFRPMQAVCSPKCASALVEYNKQRELREQAKAERKAARVAKERLKTRSDYMKEAQAEFNKYIRERDYGLPCISCGRHHKGQYHAGHYRTVGGSPELRFEPLNCHKQCAPCNNHKSGDIVNYRISLVKKIGADKVAWLEGPHEAKRYTVEDLKELKRHYRALSRELIKEREKRGIDG